MTVAEAVSDFLASKGCTHAFGVVGGANLALFEAIGRKLTVVSTHHEQAAAISASYYYRTCGRIAPVLVTAGGGTVNAFTGVMEAHHDSVPCLVLSGNELSRFFRLGPTRSIGFQGFNPIPIVHYFTKKAHQAVSGQDAVDNLRYLYDLALWRRRGAVWLDIPQDIAAGPL